MANPNHFVASNHLFQMRTDPLIEKAALALGLSQCSGSQKASVCTLTSPADVRVNECRPIVAPISALRGSERPSEGSMMHSDAHLQQC